MILERDRKQLATLKAIIQPARSLAARLDALSPDDRAQYERWGARCEQWLKRCREQHSDEIEIEARPYARIFDGYGPPTLRKDVATKLFSEVPTLLKTDSDEQAMRKYMDYMETG